MRKGTLEPSIPDAALQMAGIYMFFFKHSLSQPTVGKGLRRHCTALAHLFGQLHFQEGLQHFEILALQLWYHMACKNLPLIALQDLPLKLPISM